MYLFRSINNPDKIPTTELPEYVDVFEKLTLYCKSKTVRDRHIVLGNQIVVDQMNKEMDILYLQLPDWAKWERNQN
jgi:hypothetical protein